MRTLPRWKLRLRRRNRPGADVGPLGVDWGWWLAGGLALYAGMVVALWLFVWSASPRRDVRAPPFAMGKAELPKSCDANPPCGFCRTCWQAHA